MQNSAITSVYSVQAGLCPVSCTSWTLISVVVPADDHIVHFFHHLRIAKIGGGKVLLYVASEVVK